MSATRSRSPPAEKASPAPRTITARTSGSRSIARQTSARSRCMSASAALSRPGLLITMRSTPGAGRSSCRLANCSYRSINSAPLWLQPARPGILPERLPIGPCGVVASGDARDHPGPLHKNGGRAEEMAAGAPLLELARVNNWFCQLHVLQDADLRLAAGEVALVLGPSGSGKSTLCRTINRLEPIDSGSIRLDGRPLPAEGRELARLRSDVGMVFQQFNLFAHKSVLDNLTLGPVKVRGQPRRQAELRARELLQRVGVADQAHKLPAQLSGGQQQRVAIARALAMDPKLLLFDEPTSALDPEMINEVLDVMRDLAAAGMTMMVISHEMGFARSAANRVVFMDAGQILEQGPPEEFFANPRTERAEDFLSKIISH